MPEPQRGDVWVVDLGLPPKSDRVWSSVSRWPNKTAPS
jgi:hypothetical protein